MFWEITLHGKPVLYCSSSNKTFDFGKVFQLLRSCVKNEKNFQPHRICMKAIRPEEDNNIDWIDITP